MKQKHFQYQHAFLGCGNMAEAILSSMINIEQIDPKKIIINRRSLAKLKNQAKKWKVHSTQDSLQASSHSRFLWLGVKPQQAPDLLKNIGDTITDSQTVISMMAGVSIKALRHYIHSKCGIIRIMPNTPSMIGLGAIGAFFPKNLKAKTEIQSILEGMGKLELVSKEKLLDIVTGLSGSGPAFIYQIAQAMIDGARHKGLPLKQAKSLCLQTLLGACKMLELSKKTPDQLTIEVTSKGGTTEAGLQVLQNEKALKAIAQAVQTASHKAEMLRLEAEKCTY